MATSGQITGLATVQDIILDALIELQVYSANQQLKPSDGALGIRRLNWMLKESDDDGAALWRWRYNGTVVVPGGTDEVVIGDRVVDVMEARVQVSAGNERTLDRREWMEFASYPNKATPGQPSIFVPKPGLDSYAVQFWPVPTVNTTILYTGARVSEDVTALTETLDVPQQYTHTVMMGLAVELAPAFGRASDPNTALTIKKAQALYQRMRAADRPASYFLLPG